MSNRGKQEHSVHECPAERRAQDGLQAFVPHLNDEVARKKAAHVREVVGQD